MIVDPAGMGTAGTTAVPVGCWSMKRLLKASRTLLSSCETLLSLELPDCRPTG